MFLYKKYKILNYDFDFLIIIFFIYYEYLNFIMNFFYFIFFLHNNLFSYKSF